MLKKSNEIYALLQNRFGQASCELNFSNNYELIVAVVLSARCTDKRVNIVSKELFKKYPTPKDLAQADIKDVEKLIYSCGFYKNKSKAIISLAKDIDEKFNGIVPDNFEGLTSLSGVGRKTANVVLLEVFGIANGIAVDTHAKRISNKLGLSNNSDPSKIEQDLLKIFPKISLIMATMDNPFTRWAPQEASISLGWRPQRFSV